MDTITFQRIIEQTFWAFLLAAAAGTLPISGDLHQFLIETDQQSILDVILAALLPCLPLLINGITSNFAGIKYVFDAK